MDPVEKKFVCDLISVVANAIATNSISDAENYLMKRYQYEHGDLINHAINVMFSIKNNGIQSNSGF